MSRHTPNTRAWQALAAQVRREELVCWRCGREIDQQAAPRSRYSYSAGHVVPVSRAPWLALVRDNVHAEHYGDCNSRARDSDPGPIRHSRLW